MLRVHSNLSILAWPQDLSLPIVDSTLVSRLFFPQQLLLTTQLLSGFISPRTLFPSCKLQLHGGTALKLDKAKS